MSPVLQHIAVSVLTAAIVVGLAFWSTRTRGPFWPALVFVIARSAISYSTGATPLTTLWTAVAALGLGLLYFWALKQTQGRLVWWLILVLGVVLFSW